MSTDGGDVALRPAQRRLLAIMVLDSRRRVDSDELIFRFWGEDAPPTSKAALQTHISALRRLIPKGCIVTEGSGYVFDPAGHHVDAEEFSAAAARARAALTARQWEEVVSSASFALALWRGRPYQELDGHDFARAEIARLEEMRAALLEARVESLVAMGRSADVLPELEALVRDHPLRERLWASLMTARHRLGRHAEAVRAYRDAEEALAELGLEPSPELRSLEARIITHGERPGPSAQHNLPAPLSSFVGRTAELSDCAQRLAANRLVTLTGLGGSGKTRLAIEAARAGLDDFPAGAWFVDLSALRDTDQVAFQVATAVGLRPEGADVSRELVDALAASKALLIIDNAEHLLGGVAATTRLLLAACADLRVLVTSRFPLGIPGESVLDVPPLAVPAAHVADPEDIMGYDAVRLFAERAADALTGFVVDAATAVGVAAVCRRLDGVPLAIELAATRVRSLTPAEIAGALADQFDLLDYLNPSAPPRHQTVSDAIAWSHDLLSPSEQAVLGRLAVFHGSFDLTAIEEVCSGDGIDQGEVARIVSNLVDHSLLAVVTNQGGRRFRLLELVRDFAQTRLAETNAAIPLADRHAAWCERLARTLAEHAHTPSGYSSVRSVAADEPNLAAALTWRTEQRDPAGVALLANALARVFNQVEAHPQEISHLRLALEWQPADPEGLADLETRLARALINKGEVDEGRRHLAAAERRLEGLPGSPTRTMTALTRAWSYRIAATSAGSEGIDDAATAVSLAREVGNPYLEWRATVELARQLAWAGNPDAGLDLIRATTPLARGFGQPELLLDHHGWMIEVAWLHPTERRDLPLRIAEEAIGLTDGEPEMARSWKAWLMYVWIQTGRWDDAERAIAAIRPLHGEGTGLLAHMTAGTLLWMQGRLDQAAAEVNTMRRRGVHERWHQEFFALAAEIAADRGLLHEVRAIAEEHLGFRVHATEEGMKLGTLGALVRAEIESARSVGGREHLARGQSVLARMREILSAHPAPAGGNGLELPETHLAFAEAEISRVTGPDPELWRAATSRADYLYFRLYGRLRLAEALAADGHLEEAEVELASTADVLATLGAQGLSRLHGEISDGLAQARPSRRLR